MVDITRAEYDLLCRIRCGDTLSDSDMELARVLMHKRLIASGGDWVLRVTTLGTEAMLRYEEMIQRECDERTRQEAKERSQRTQAVKDKKQDRRHDFFVAAFGGAVTLAVEHASELVDFFKRLVDIITFH